MRYEIGKRTIILDFFHQWDWLIDRKARWNWIDITLINLSFERAFYLDTSNRRGYTRAMVTLLGFSVELTTWTKGK